MSKINTLLASKKKLTSEVNALEAVLLEATETQVLTLGSASNTIQFEEKDSEVGNKVLAVVEQEYHRLDKELKAVALKVSALEALL